MALLPPSQQFYANLYTTLVTAADPTDDVSEFVDFQVKAQVLGGIIAGASQDSYALYQNLYPQYANSQGINLQLAAAGVPITYPASQAQLETQAQGLESSETYNVPLGTIVTAPNGATYKVISSTNSNLVNVVITNITPGTTDILYVASIASGQGTGQLATTILTFSPPIVSVSGNYTLTTTEVLSSVDGANQESLTAATNRLVTIKQVPLCGSRSSDFYNLAAPDIPNSVTDAVVLINNELRYSTAPTNVGIYDISGTPIDDTILDMGLASGSAVVFSRTSSSLSISNTQAIMDAQDIVGAFPLVNTVGTQEMTTLTGSPNPYFKVVVTLQPGYVLATQVTLTDGTFTIAQLIQREVRRAICQQPYGASLTYNFASGAITGSTIPISVIGQQLDVALGTSTTTGIIGNYLTNRSVYQWNGSSYVYDSTINIPYPGGQPYGLPVANSDKLLWIYDISTTAAHIYPNILVSLTL